MKLRTSPVLKLFAMAATLAACSSRDPSNAGTGKADPELQDKLTRILERGLAKADSLERIASYDPQTAFPVMKRDLKREFKDCKCDLNVDFNVNTYRQGKVYYGTIQNNGGDNTIGVLVSGKSGRGNEMRLEVHTKTPQNFVSL